MRPGADSSHRTLFYDRDALLQLRECENRLSVSTSICTLNGHISNVRGKSDVTYSLLPASERIRRPSCGIRLYGATVKSRAFPCVPAGVGVGVGVGAGAECVASTPL